MQMLFQDYFTLFGLKKTFLQEKDQIKARYYQLQKQFHPDNFVNAIPQERVLAANMAASINDAYQTLKNPLKRAIYLLKCKGISLNAEEDTKMSSEFLMTQFALRERMESPENKETLLQEIADELAIREQQLTHFLEADLASARNCVREMQFYVKLLEELG